MALGSFLGSRSAPIPRSVAGTYRIGGWQTVMCAIASPRSGSSPVVATPFLRSEEGGDEASVGRGDRVPEACSLARDETERLAVSSPERHPVAQTARRMQKKEGTIMSRTIKTAALLALAVGLFAGAAVPAYADDTWVLAFTGNAKLEAPICYPTPGILCAPGATEFTFKAGPQKDTKADALPSLCQALSVGKNNSLQECTISANGTVDEGPIPTGSAHCGSSSGVFNVSVTKKKGAGQTVSEDGASWIGIGGLLIVTGADFNAVTLAFPKADTGESCATGADEFHVIGVSVVTNVPNE